MVDEAKLCRLSLFSFEMLVAFVGWALSVGEELGPFLVDQCWLSKGMVHIAFAEHISQTGGFIRTPRKL